ncbi:hypothetical protein STENM327S_02161 [Streptomyces tendae]
MPSTTHTCSGEFHPRAAARDTAPSSASPLSTAFTTSDSRRASQAPRASAACAYTWAVAKAISRAYTSSASRSTDSSPGAATSSIADSITSMVVRTISTVCRSVIARVSSRGAVPNTSVEMAWGASGRRNHSVNAAMPAWATSPIQERFSGGIARYHGSVSSIRAMACAASDPEDCSSRFSVAVCGWAGWAGASGLPVSGSGTGTRLPYRAGRVCRRGYGERRDGRTPRRRALSGR